VNASDFKDYVLAGCGLATTAVVVWNTFNIKQLEKNTNSIKDALVATTGKEAYARGRSDQKDGVEEG
jgi:hypothetical protein